MRVALLTTWKERCGISAYAEQLVQAMDQVTRVAETPFDYWVLDRSTWPNFPQLMAGRLGEYDVLHLNYEPGLFGWLPPSVIQDLRHLNMKTVLTLHTSHEGDNRNWAMTQVFDRVVVHEKTTEGFTHIPMGIPILDWKLAPIVQDNFRVGTVGFPFPWKGFDIVARAAKEMGMRCLIIIPESDHWDSNLVKQHLLSINPAAQVVTDWMEPYQVQHMLASCAVNAFLYDGSGNYGISGAVRLALGTGQPVLCTRNRQFRDLYDYEDEVNFVQGRNLSSVISGLDMALTSGRRPKRLLEDMSWARAGQMYYDLYRELVK